MSHQGTKGLLWKCGDSDSNSHTGCVDRGGGLTLGVLRVREGEVTQVMDRLPTQNSS